MPSTDEKQFKVFGGDGTPLLSFRTFSQAEDYANYVRNLANTHPESYKDPEGMLIQDKTTNQVWYYSTEFDKWVSDE